MSMTTVVRVSVTVAIVLLFALVVTLTYAVRAAGVKDNRGQCRRAVAVYRVQAAAAEDVVKSGDLAPRLRVIRAREAGLLRAAIVDCDQVFPYPPVFPVGL